MDAPDLSKVEAFLQSRGVSAEKLRLAQAMLEQMGIRYDSQPEEMPDQGEMMSMFNQLTSNLDDQTRQQLEGLLGQNMQQPSRLNSSEDVLALLKKMKKE
jgi:hypothetical protein